MKRRDRALVRRMRGRSARRALMHLIVGASVLQAVDASIPPERRTERVRLHVRFLLHSVVMMLTVFTIVLHQPVWPAFRSITSASYLPMHAEEQLSPGLQPQVIHNSSDLNTLLIAPATRVLEPPASRPQVVTGFFRTTHALMPGETLGFVAEQYGISLESLIVVNGLEQGDALVSGQILQIPHISGLTHTVYEQGSLREVAARYGVSEGAILGFGPNHLFDGTDVPVGKTMFIPNAAITLPDSLLAAFGGYEGLMARTVEPAGVVLQNETNLRQGPGTDYLKVDQLDMARQVLIIARHKEWLKVRLGETEGWVRQDLLDVAAEVIAGTIETTDFPPPPPRWVWPARGTMTSRFGPRWGGFHNGLDIANRAWSPIMAARSGVVREAGWCRGYGYCVKINHGGGVVTVYGHLIDQPVVRAGQEVTAGELIGHMGSTYDRAGGGYSTGVHLHFSVFINGSAIDPLRVLP